MSPREVKAALEVGTGQDKKAKIFLKDYQGEFYKLYVTLTGDPNFELPNLYHVQVLRKSVFSPKKSVFRELNKNHQNSPRHILIKDVF